MKNVYFISDAHLGSWAIEHSRTQERRLVNFLDSIKTKAAAVYMLGDMFDFWHEYRYVVPKGFTRFLGKVSELVDSGVEVHFFTGNHDIWCGDYLQKECGVVLHRRTLTTEIYGKVFMMAHGDGLGDGDTKYKILRRIFHDPICQKLFASIHPRWGLALGLSWAKHSRMKRPGGEEPAYQGDDNEPLMGFARKYLIKHPEINYFIFGHRHVELDSAVSSSSRMFLLGDWISKFTYVCFDGENIFLENYVEGDSQP